MKKIANNEGGSTAFACTSTVPSLEAATRAIKMMRVRMQIYPGSTGIDDQGRSDAAIRDSDNKQRSTLSMHLASTIRTPLSDLSTPVIRYRCSRHRFLLPIRVLVPP